MHVINELIFVISIMQCLFVELCFNIHGFRYEDKTRANDSLSAKKQANGISWSPRINRYYWQTLNSYLSIVQCVKFQKKISDHRLPAIVEIMGNSLQWGRGTWIISSVHFRVTRKMKTFRISNALPFINLYYNPPLINPLYNPLPYKSPAWH